MYYWYVDIKRVKVHVEKLDINLPYVSLLHVTVHGMCPYFQRKIDSIIVMKSRIVTYYLNCHIYEQKEMEH